MRIPDWLHAPLPPCAITLPGFISLSFISWEDSCITTGAVCALGAGRFLHKKVEIRFSKKEFLVSIRVGNSTNLSGSFFEMIFFDDFFSREAFSAPNKSAFRQP